MTTMRISVDLELDNQFFEDIMVTALEGGSNYWIDHIKINHPGGAKPKGIPNSIWATQALINGGSIDFCHDDGISSMGMGNLSNGVKLWVETNPNSIEIFKFHGVFTIDTCNIDDGDADNILQYALFGKVVYG